MSRTLLLLILANLLFKLAHAQSNTTTTTTTTTTTESDGDDKEESYKYPLAVIASVVGVIVLLVVLRNCCRDEIKKSNEVRQTRSKDLLEAMSENRWVDVCAMIDKYRSSLTYTVTGDRGNSIFHYAALFGRLSDLDALLESKNIRLNDLDPCNDDGDSVLRFALRNLSKFPSGSIKSVRYMLGQRSINARPVERNAELMFDVVNHIQDEQVLGAIFHLKKPGLNGEPVELATGGKLYLGHFINFLSEVNMFGLTPLHQALHTNNRVFLDFVMRHDEVVLNLSNESFVYSGEGLHESLLDAALNTDMIDAAYFTQLMDELFSKSTNWATQIPDMEVSGSALRQQKIILLNHKKQAATVPPRATQSHSQISDRKKHRVLPAVPHELPGFYHPDVSA